MKYQIKMVGNHRGNPRLYFQSQSLADNGFLPGHGFDVTTENRTLVLTAKRPAMGQYTVSRKAKAAEGEFTPVIDINSAVVLGHLAACSVVKVVMRPGRIEISRLASAELAQQRTERLKAALVAGVAVAGLAFGGGILDHSAHAGMLQAGVQAHTVLANEIDDDLLEHARGANPVLTERTVLISAPMQEAIQDDDFMQSLPRADFLVAGIPCSGASRAGKSKNSIEIMEDHPEVGHLAHAFLTFMHRLQPGMFLLENVPEYASSASASIIRAQTRDMGYDTHEVQLDASHFGAMEGRVRWFMLGVPQGTDMDLSNLAPAVRPVRTVASILDAHNDHTWGEFNYLKDKAVRDKAAGKGFQMQVVDRSATKVPTLRKGYHKGGSTDPLLQHPDNVNLLRLFSGDEHARIKGVDPVLVAGLSNTDKHILLGQSVVPGPVVALVRRAVECVRRSLFVNEEQVPRGYRLDRAVG
jgi:DNA (cytosine-5)-methyltransferase 1